jgi:hypothetical protein
MKGKWVVMYSVSMIVDLIFATALTVWYLLLLILLGLFANQVSDISSYETLVKLLAGCMEPAFQEMYDKTKVVIRSRKSKDRQSND